MPGRGLLPCLLLGLLAGSVLAQQEVSEAELARLQDSIRKVRSELDNTRAERSAAAKSLEQTELAIARVQTALRQLATEIETLGREREALASQQESLEAARAAQLEQVGQYLRAASLLGQGSELKLLLNQDDPARAARLLQYYRYLSSARSERLSEFRATLASLSEVSTDLAQNTRELEARQAKLGEEEKELAASQAQRLALLDELDIELAEGGQALARLEAQQREIELLLEELRSSIADLDLGVADTPFAERRGKLPWPVDARPSNRFGSQRAQGDLLWEGLFLPAAAGTDVRAVHHGRVVFADWLGNSGQLLIIDHGDGYMSLYAHNQQLYRTVGEWVSGGDRIASVGNTGGQREPGLYFEIRRNGTAENPVNWCVPLR